jgi:hypothetical protein
MVDRGALTLVGLPWHLQRRTTQRQAPTCEEDEEEDYKFRTYKNRDKRVTVSERERQI